MDLGSALRALPSFDHAACDRLAVAQHVHFAHFVFKGGSFEGLYVGPLFLTVVSVLALYRTIAAYRRRATLVGNARVTLWAGPVMCVFLLVCWALLLQGLVEYAQVCTALLRHP